MLLRKKTTETKTLVIMRHAKSSWANAELDDFDRPLSEQGEKNAAEMGRFLFRKIGTPQLILSSTAKRAYDTAKIAARNMEYDEANILTDRKLYLAWTNDMMQRIAAIPDEIDNCIIVGHNPGMTDLVNHLDVQLDNLPTASAVCFEFNIASWRKISPRKAKFQWLQAVKEL